MSKLETYESFRIPPLLSLSTFNPKTNLVGSAFKIYLKILHLSLLVQLFPVLSNMVFYFDYCSNLLTVVFKLTLASPSHAKSTLYIVAFKNKLCLFPPASAFLRASQHIFLYNIFFYCSNFYFDAHYEKLALKATEFYEKCTANKVRPM